MAERFTLAGSSSIDFPLAGIFIFSTTGGGGGGTGGTGGAGAQGNQGGQGPQGPTGTDASTIWDDNQTLSWTGMKLLTGPGESFKLKFDGIATSQSNMGL